MRGRHSNLGSQLEVTSPEMTNKQTRCLPPVQMTKPDAGTPPALWPLSLTPPQGRCKVPLPLNIISLFLQYVQPKLISQSWGLPALPAHIETSSFATAITHETCKRYQCRLGYMLTPVLLELLRIRG